MLELRWVERDEWRGDVLTPVKIKVLQYRAKEVVAVNGQIKIVGDWSPWLDVPTAKPDGGI